MTTVGIRAALVASTGIACLAWSMPAEARNVNVNVRSQSAQTAILEIARQSGIQILVSQSVVRGKRTRAVRGSMEPQRALDLLLADTGLRAVRINDRTFTVIADRRSAPPATEAPIARQDTEDIAYQQAERPVIVVTGFRSSLRQALTKKREETGSVDTILAEDVGKFPDSNLAEAMQRLPGVALSRGDGGEGRNITVRGLAAEFTRVRINGMEAASQTGASDAYGGSNTGRAFDFNVFPSEIFSSLSVRKTASADVEEGSLGAIVDLRTLQPLDYQSDFVLTASARAVYNNVAREADPKFSGVISKTFADRTFGVLGSVTYSRRRTRDVGYSAVLVLPAWVNGGFCSPIGVAPQNPENSANKGTDALNCSTGNPRTGSIEAWDKIQSQRGPSDRPGGGAFFPRLPRYLDSQQDFNRLGATLTFQWAPSEDTNVSLDGLFTRYSVARADSYISGLSFARSASNNGQPMTSVRDVHINDLGSVVYGLYDGVDVRSERWVSKFNTTFKQATLHFDHCLSDGFKISGLLGHEVSDFSQPSRGWFNIDANDTNGFSVDFRRNANYPTINFGIDVSNPENFEYGPGLPDGTVRGTLSEVASDRVTTVDTFNINGEWTPVEGVRVLGGGQYRRSDYRAHNLRLDPARQAIEALPAGVSLSDLTLQVTDLDKLLGHGAPASWTAADRDKFREAIGFDDSWLCGEECGNGPQGVRETVHSAFAMIKADWSDILPIPVRSDIGVRYVHTHQYSFGYIPVANPAGSRYPTSGQLAEARRTYEDWLPSGSVAAELTGDLLLRVSVARVMSRPDLAPLIPDSGVDAVGRRGTIANPNLDPIHATTYDASLEWYFRPGSLLSIAYFRKDIATYIQSISSLIPFNQLGLPEELLANSQTLPTELFTINRLASTPGGKLEGIEVYAQEPLTFLPGVLGKFGLLGSLTLVRSRINYILQSANGIPTLTTTDDLLGLSRYSASGTLYYEDSMFNARVTGNYRSRYIRTIPSGAADSNYIANRPTFYVDFQTSIRLNPRLKLLVEGQNLTNEDNVQYIDSVRQDALFALKSGRTFTMGVNLLF